MTEWKITVANKTGEDSASGEGSIVKFALFQVPSEKDETNTYPCAWVVDKVAYPGEIHDMTLPNEFELAIVDEVNGSERITGPFPVSSGKEVYITQKSRDDPPSHEIKEGKALDDNTAPMIQVFNNQGNIQPLTMVLYKKQKKLIMSDKVLPGSSVNMSVKQQINIHDAGNTNDINEGDSLKDQGIVTSSTMFKLLPSTPRITIDVHRGPTGQLSFNLSPL
ncbi:uncharacterized protein LOC114522266 [Dendronephthya gigantea]|uniref:uncharacterized protein LOC114522266 n=1 Tax=Dendronephthya gigantea TaxID=151771 RepID=UPI00106D999C|nr:uncharacterized protein LOC114522266 [Dendronephthya gigantea]